MKNGTQKQHKIELLKSLRNANKALADFNSNWNKLDNSLSAPAKKAA